MASTTKTLNTGLVAVSDRNGGFHIFMTGGLYGPSGWLAGRLDGQGWFATKADLEGSAEANGHQLVRHADYYQLAVKPDPRWED